MTDTITCALLVQPTSEYGTRKLTATVVIPQANGELFNPPSWDWRGSGGAQYNGLEVAAYLGELADAGRSSTGGKLWGFGATYRPHHIDRAEHARAIAAVLTRIDKHLHKANAADGYLPDDDFPGYLRRVAAALKIRTLYVRNTAGGARVTGETYRKVNGAELQTWVDTVRQHAEAGKFSEIGLSA